MLQSKKIINQSFQTREIETSQKGISWDESSFKLRKKKNKCPHIHPHQKKTFVAEINDQFGRNHFFTARLDGEHLIPMTAENDTLLISY